MLDIRDVTTFNAAQDVWDNTLFILRGFNQTGHCYITNAKINGQWLPSTSIPTTASSGKLKISRVGSQIQVFFNEGSGWNLLYTYKGSPSFTGDVKVGITGYSGDNGTFSVDSDFLSYEGKPASYIIVNPPWYSKTRKKK